VSDEILARALRAERAAEAELARIPDWLWDGRSVPVPIDTLADSHYGLLVSEQSDLAKMAALGDDHISGLLFPGRREIWVDAEEAARAPTRRRFTIGHELGHWVLHSFLDEPEEEVVHCRTVEVRDEAAVEGPPADHHLPDFLAHPPRELDANQFAAAVLMPRPLVEAQADPLARDVHAMAKAFGVSPIAMERRLWFLQEME
jgi:hypothetical protein